VRSVAKRTKYANRSLKLVQSMKEEKRIWDPKITMMFGVAFDHRLLG